MKLEWNTCLKAGITIFLLFLGINYWEMIAGLIMNIFSAAFPLILGAVIAYIINIPMGFYEKHYFPQSSRRAAAVSRRPVCMIGAFLTVLAAAALIIWLILPQLGECLKIILAELPIMFENLLKYAENFHLLPEDILAFLNDIDWKSVIRDLAEVVTSGVGNLMSTVVSVVTSVFSGIVTALLSVIFSFYLLLSKDKLQTQCKHFIKHYFKETWNSRIGYTASVLNDSFHRYIVGQCTEAVILGVLCTVGMLLFGFPYALMIGALIAFTALIPVAGAYIGAGVGAFMILTESPVQALLFLIFIVVLQQIEGNLIYPKVVGSSIGLPGIWVLAAVTIGGGISGILGMLVGVPLAAAVYRMIREDMHKNISTSEIPAAEKEQNVLTEGSV